ncbi:STOREKEEPER protein [Ricinus communis]|uniref:Transcription regulator, putative n=1 Tax=Ricinus communis TaxID=3988 RepID=B9RPN8_RICCO|nr:STOREKEEPER protein [Ricinus communis]EEF46654.1 transcription regulator, putative [Ricinus communis]|eukprot:XP_002515707.1 STOREKEEPER protein [Ricinus communis]
MAPRRLSENPPPAASDEEEEEESDSESDEGNTEQNGAVDKHDDENDNGNPDDDEEEEEEEEDKESPVSKKSVVPATPQKSDSATESDDSESTQPSPSLSAFTIKLYNRSPKPNKTASSKRPAESDSMGPTNKKKKPTAGVGEDEVVKRGAVQRLWSEDDEIVVLNGLSQYKSEKGADPYSEMGAFYEYIKKSLHVDVSRNQLIDKIRRLKKKYGNNMKRGQDPVFTKSHDEKSFQLSKKLWGKNDQNVNNDNDDNIAGGGVTLGLLANQLSSKKPIRAPNVEEKDQIKSKEKIETKSAVVKGEGVWEKYPSLSEALESEEGLSDGVKVSLRKHLGMIEKGKLKELDDKWKKLRQAELELFVQRMELVHDQVQLALHSIKSSDI